MSLWRAGLVWLLTISFLGCAQYDDVPKLSTNHSIRSAIILVPGYYGTRLVRASDEKLIWISVTQALFGDVPLTLPVPGLGLNDAVHLQADGILEKVPLVPLLYSVDGYGAMLEALQKYGRGRATIVPFSYDWRDDLMANVRKLDAVITELRASGITDIRIVAHSMGGFITAYYLRYGTQDPDKAVETWAGATQLTSVVLMGVPFKGTMTAFRNSQYGVKIGLNRILLQPTAVASFPATYYLLPTMDTDVLLAPDLQPIKGAVRDGANWETYHWGLLKPSPLSKDIVDRQQTYTSEWLARSKRFSALIFRPVTTQRKPSIPMLSITGRGQVTLATGVWDRSRRSETKPIIFDVDMLAEAMPHADPTVLFKDGDGTVTTESAALPPAYAETFQVTHRQYDIGHVDLITAPNIQQDVVAFLAAR
jgi:pimeloyl-ACP methyl ester carboxylesterase